jgi:hypothetical protein
MERKLRKHVEETEHPLTGWDNKPTTSPPPSRSPANSKTSPSSGSVRCEGSIGH